MSDSHNHTGTHPDPLSSGSNSPGNCLGSFVLESCHFTRSVLVLLTAHCVTLIPGHTGKNHWSSTTLKISFHQSFGIIFVFLCNIKWYRIWIIISGKNAFKVTKKVLSFKFFIHKYKSVLWCKDKKAQKQSWISVGF